MDGKILMADVIPLLPVPRPQYGKSAYNIPCPRCDGHRQKDKHLNISIVKNVFRCARCGWNGGIFDLYAYYTHTPRDEVRSELMRILGKDTPNQTQKPPAGVAAPVLPAMTDAPAADIEIRHAAYSALLSVLKLAPDHQANLLGRGLSQDAVTKNGYKTTPVGGGRLIAKRLTESGIRIEGVPGFYKDTAGIWTFIGQKRGIFVPVRDLHGRIQGMQIRRDNADKRKYRWVSSSGIADGSHGCGAAGWVHLAGPVRERIILIEGPMKADVVYHLTGQSVLAIPGVNSLKYLEPALRELRESGLDHVMTAFDMDFLKNPHVRDGYAELTALLGRTGIRFGTYLWRPGYNGLDDYIWECCLNRGQQG